MTLEILYLMTDSKNWLIFSWPKFHTVAKSDLFGVLFSSGQIKVSTSHNSEDWYSGERKKGKTYAVHWHSSPNWLNKVPSPSLSGEVTYNSTQERDLTLENGGRLAVKYGPSVAIAYRGTWPLSRRHLAHLPRFVRSVQFRRMDSLFLLRASGPRGYIRPLDQRGERACWPHTHTQTLWLFIIHHSFMVQCHSKWSPMGKPLWNQN